MAHLTRSQKYAHLNLEVANDKEQSTTTEQLASYEEKLKNITEALSPKVEETVVEEVVEPVLETPIDEAINFIDQFLNETRIDKEEPAEEEVVEEVVEPAKYTWEEFDNSKVNDLESILADLEKAVETVSEPVEQTQVTEEEPVFEEITEELPDFEQVQSIDDILDEVFDNVPVEQPTEEPVFEEVQETVEEQPAVVEEEVVLEEPVVEEQTEGPTFEEVQEQVDEQPVEEVIEESQEQPVIEEQSENEDVFEELPPIEEVVLEEGIIDIPDFTEVVEPTFEEVQETVEEQPEPVEEVVVEEVNEQPIEEVEEPVIEALDVDAEIQDVIDNTMMVEELSPAEVVETFDTTIFDEPSSTNLFDEVKEDIDLHNRMTGEVNIDDITESLVDEVRNEVKEDSVLEADEEVEFSEQPQIDDEEFSNTVSLEITKIMEEIPQTLPVENPLVDVVEEPTIVTPIVEEIKEEENAVEIKNLNEIDIEPAANTVSSTIPFIVNANDEDEIEDEEDDEEGSNTILNIILVILIVVLIIVLGLIIFYILKTKGII